jgi:hypothetical protein
MSNKILILGASYGSLLAVKLLAAGHDVKLACLPAEAGLVNAEGVRVRIPVKGREALFEIDSRALPGTLSADVPDAIDPESFDLVALAMQEPQYRAESVRALLQRIALDRIPCMSIMNMPPLPYLARLPGVAADACRGCYTDPSVWDGFDPALVTLCSPDPQAFRPPEESTNVLQVRLPTNFKAARFESDAHTRLLRDLEAGIEAARFDDTGGRIELPVKLKVHDSVFVPLAKWSMLLAGKLPLRAGAQRAIDPRSGARRSRRHARGLHVGRGAVQVAGREGRGPRALRQIRARRRVAWKSFVRGTRARRRRGCDRARGPPGADARRATRHALGCDRCDRRARRRMAGREPAQGPGGGDDGDRTGARGCRAGAPRAVNDALRSSPQARRTAACRAPRSAPCTCGRKP